MKNKLLKRSNGGFSLVELIVVIAIMAILVGVAVPVYSSYIEKSQKAADTQLADEIKHALEIGMIGDDEKPVDFAGGVVVVLSHDSSATVECSDVEDKAFVEGILAKTFGASWATDLKLKYDSWESSAAAIVATNFTGSNYDGNEAALLGQVQGLSKLLSNISAAGLSEEAFGTGFTSFLDQNEITGDTAIGNSAVLYIAQTMSGPNSSVSADVLTEKAKAVALDQSAYDKDGNLILTAPSVQDFIGACGQSTGAAAATMYALAEAFAQETEQADTFHENVGAALEGKTNSGAALDALLKQFANLAQNAGETKANAYLDNSLSKDVSAYLSVMNAIQESEKSIMNNVGSDSCYTDGTLLSKLNAYVTVGKMNIAAGKVAIVVNVNADGVSEIVAYPLDY